MDHVQSLAATCYELSQARGGDSPVVLRFARGQWAAQAPGRPHREPDRIRVGHGRTPAEALDRLASDLRSLPEAEYKPKPSRFPHIGTEKIKLP